MRISAAGFVWLAALFTTGAAQAQSYQCRMPRAVTPPFAEREGPIRQTPVSGYTMALSWSPEYCRGRESSRAQALQCSGRHGRFGFVMHGLWPDSERGWPQWCPTQQHPTGIDVARQLCVSPSTSLVVHQWAKHGSCMTRRPATYYKVANILWNSYRWPDYDRISRQDGLTAGEIRKAFVDANPGWTSAGVGVHLNQRGWLEELRLCYDKRFRPSRCDRSRLGARDDAKAKIWRGL